MLDIAIIGAGVIGCAIARELSRYQLSTAVIEKNEDVAVATSKANSGIIHPGEDPIPGTLKAQMNIRGNELFDHLQKELDFPFKRNGSMVLCFDEADKSRLEELRQRGLKNGMPDTMRILNREEAVLLEPHLSEKVVAVLLLPTGGIVCPYELTIALAENAYDNGVEFLFNTEVEQINKEKDYFVIKTNHKQIEAKHVINAAGVHADNINNMVSQIKYEITARKGEYLLFDKSAGSMIEHTLFQLPTKMGKGVLVTPTVSGNLLVGPSAMDIDNKTNVETTRECLGDIVKKANFSVDKVPMHQVITSFAGLRAHEKDNDFIIEEAEDVLGFFNVLGIESPGLTSAPAIGEYVCKLLVDKLKSEKKTNFNPIRKNIKKFSESTEEERKILIDQNKYYGKIVCRCEQVTEAEIIEAIRRPLGGKSIDGVKRRTRAGMGRCQSGFCINRIIELLAQELGIDIEEVTKFGEGSRILMGDLKEYLGNEGGCENV